MMMKKFCFCVLVATVAFVSSTARSNISFNATTFNTNITQAPFVLNETMPTTSTTTVSIDFSFDIHPEAIDLIQNASANCHDLYKNYIVPFAMDISRAASTEFKQRYEMYQPVVKDGFNTILAEIYNKIASFANENSSSYALFDYGRVQMMAVPLESSHNHSISSTNVTSAPLVFANVSGVGNVDEMMVEMDSSENMTETVFVAPKDNITMVTYPAQLGSSNSTMASANSQANVTSTFYKIVSMPNSTTSNSTSNTTSSLDDLKWNMIFHENSTPTFPKATTPSDSLLDDFSEIPFLALNLANHIFGALFEGWEAFYKEYESFLPSLKVMEKYFINPIHSKIASVDWEFVGLVIFANIFCIGTKILAVHLEEHDATEAKRSTQYA